MHICQDRRPPEEAPAMPLQNAVLAVVKQYCEEVSYQRVAGRELICLQSCPLIVLCASFLALTGTWAGAQVEAEEEWWVFVGAWISALGLLLKPWERRNWWERWLPRASTHFLREREWLWLSGPSCVNTRWHEGVVWVRDSLTPYKLCASSGLAKRDHVLRLLEEHSSSSGFNLLGERELCTWIKVVLRLCLKVALDWYGTNANAHIGSL